MRQPGIVPNQQRIILIANKAENTFIGPYLNDCYELGVGDPAAILALGWQRPPPRFF